MKHRVCSAPDPCPRVVSARWWRAWYAGGAVLLAGWLTGCERSTPANGALERPGRDRPVPVLVARAVAKGVPQEIHAIGNVLPYRWVAVRSQITGQLTQVNFVEGQDVKQGDLLFTIDPRPPAAALQQAQANLARDQAMLENARVEAERNKKLFQAALVAHEEYDRVQANFVALQGTILADRAAITDAVLNVEFTAIRSPLDGRTGSLLIHKGNIIRAGDDVLVMINQIHPIYVAFSVPERHLPTISRLQQTQALTVEASYPNLRAAPPRGVLTFIDNTVDTTTGTIQLKATFANTDNALWPGQFVQVVMTLMTQPHAIVVPAQAIQTGPDGTFVFVVNANGTVAVRPVGAGTSREGETVVEQGLAAGETVVTDGQLQLFPGAKIEVRPGLSTPAAPSTPTR